MEIDDELLFLLGEQAPLDIGAEVVGPPEAAALAAAAEAGELGEGAPAALPVGDDEVDELPILIRSPRPLLHLLLVTARLPPHFLASGPSSFLPGVVQSLHFSPTFK